MVTVEQSTRLNPAWVYPPAWAHNMRANQPQPPEGAGYVTHPDTPPKGSSATRLPSRVGEWFNVPDKSVRKLSKDRYEFEPLVGQPGLLRVNIYPIRRDDVRYTESGWFNSDLTNVRVRLSHATASGLYLLDRITAQERLAVLAGEDAPYLPETPTQPPRSNPTSAIPWSTSIGIVGVGAIVLGAYFILRKVS